MQPIVTPLVPSIPVPGEDLKSLRTAVMAIKQVLESTTGDAGGNHPGMFVSNQRPVGRRKGDLWITEYPSITVSYWTGSDWVLLATAP